MKKIPMEVSKHEPSLRNAQLIGVLQYEYISNMFEWKTKKKIKKIDNENHTM